MQVCMCSIFMHVRRFRIKLFVRSFVVRAVAVMSILGCGNVRSVVSLCVCMFAGSHCDVSEFQKGF